MTYPNLDEALSGIEVTSLLLSNQTSLKTRLEYNLFVKQINAVSKILRTHIPYYSHLELLSNTLFKELDNFPHHCCIKSSKIVAQVLGNKYNLTEVAGNYVYVNGDLGYHAWNYDPNRRLYLDLTLYHFNKLYPSIAILPETIFILQKDAESTSILQKENNSFSWFVDKLQWTVREKDKMVQL